MGKKVKDDVLTAPTKDKVIEQLDPKKFFVDETERRYCLESSIFKLTNINDGMPFIGAILQCMNINYYSGIPTAGVLFDTKAKTFKMLINPYFFCKILTFEQRVAVLTHEIYHITNKHVFFNRQIMTDTSVNHMRMNIAMDLVINQTIKNLPDFCMLISNFKDNKGKPFPKNGTSETYYDLLTDDATMTRPKRDESGQPVPDGEKEEIRVGDMTKEDEFDSHDGWGEGEEKDKLEAARDLIKRSMQKNSNAFNNAKGVKDLLEEIEKSIQKLDYKAILLSALRKSLPSKDVMNTWKRPSRRYGDLAPGKKIGNMPKVEVFMDTSGSISVEEANEFLRITNNFMVTGVDKCTLNYFHSELYHTEQVKKNQKIDTDKIQSGGTELTGVFQKILKSKADLNIIITDGFFGMPNIPEDKLRKCPQTIFVISKGGSTDHPLVKYGKTFKYE